MQKRTVSVGPNATTPLDSTWLNLDTWAAGAISWQTVVTGTVVYSVQTTNDDPNDPFNPVATPTWDSVLTGASGISNSTSGTLPAVPAYIKIRLTSGSGSVALTVIQALSAPY